MKKTKCLELNYTGVIETWSVVVIALYIYLSLLIGVYGFVTKETDSLPICLLGTALFLCYSWLPGIVMATGKESIYYYLARVNPVYTDPRSIFAGGTKQLSQLRIGGPANIAALVVILVLAGLVVIMSIMGVTVDKHGITLAIWFGMLLSWAGAVIIGLRMAYDAIQGKRKLRWVL